MLKASNILDTGQSKGRILIPSFLAANNQSEILDNTLNCAKLAVSRPLNRPDTAAEVVTAVWVWPAGGRH
jgi:hypothetical protein